MNQRYRTLLDFGPVDSLLYPHGTIRQRNLAHKYNDLQFAGVVMESPQLITLLDEKFRYQGGCPWRISNPRTKSAA
jgi:hypothetical protein